MSRGPGRIERAIRELFDANPDLAFVTDELCLNCYPALVRHWNIKRQHRVAVVRAAESVVGADPDWKSKHSWVRGQMLIFYNAASIRSVAMADALLYEANQS